MIPWFFNIPLKGGEGLLSSDAIWVVNLMITISLLVLSVGFLANKRWAVVLYWIYCVPWVLLFAVPLFNGEYLILKSFSQIAEVIVLIVGPPVLGLFLWRQIDLFTPGLLPLSWRRSLAEKYKNITEKNF